MTDAPTPDPLQALRGELLPAVGVDAPDPNNPDDWRWHPPTPEVCRWAFHEIERLRQQVKELQRNDH